MDRTQTISASVQDVKITLLITVALVVMVIFLFLLNVRATLIPSAVIPLALLGASAVMLALNFSLDNLSLMALTIAVGFVVDDAIVMVEVIWQHIEHGEKPFDAALAGSREISFTVLSISISLIAVFTPLMFMGGVVGLLMREFALTLSAAVLVSLVLTLTVTPMLCAQFLKPPKPPSLALHALAKRRPKALGDGLCARSRRRAAAQIHDLDGFLRLGFGRGAALCHSLDGLLSAAGYRVLQRRDADLAGCLF